MNFSRKAISTIIVVLLSMSLILSSNVQSVMASGTIYIKADGSIDPPTAPIQRVGDLYTLTGNISDSIVIQRNNMTLDGAGHTIQGAGPESGNGIYLRERSNVTIRDMEIRSFHGGIFLLSSSNNNIYGNNITTNYGQGITLLEYSSNNGISGNKITNNGGGISLSSSSNNNIYGNNITNSFNGIRLSSSNNNNISGNNIMNNQYGIELDSSSNNGISGNNLTNNNDGIYLYSSKSNNIYGNNITVNSNRGICLSSSSNGNIISGNNIKANSYDGIFLYSSSNNGISGNNLTNNGCGVYLYSSSTNNNISGNNITANRNRGICLVYSSNGNIISGNNIKANSYDGIFLYSSSNNGISGNNLTNNGCGVYLYSSKSNNIYGNNITNNNDGIYLYSSKSNNIYGNNITANSYRGISLVYSSSINEFFHNNIINNAIQAYSSSSVNVWDNGYPSGGNYWSDYAGVDLYRGLYQNLTGSDGMGDTPYIIDVNNKDRYPLMRPFTPLILSEYPFPFVVDGVLNVTFVVGGSHPHGPFNWGAWTVDVLGGIGVASRLSQEAYKKVNMVQVVDDDVADYDPVTGVTVYWSEIKTSALISIGSGAVNLISLYYNSTMPFKLVRNSTGVYVNSDPSGKSYDSEWGYDYAVIALIEEPEVGPVLLIYGITGKGSQAACLVLQNYDKYPQLLKGKTVILKWQDGNGDNIPDLDDQYILVEWAL